MNSVTFEHTDDSETPDGEYIVLSFPDDDVRFDFFLASGNYILQVWSDGYTQLYRAVYADGVTNAADIMSEWYDALVTVNQGLGLDASGSMGEKFVGE